MASSQDVKRADDACNTASPRVEAQQNTATLNAPPNFRRRDHLAAIEVEMQALWTECNIYHAEPEPTAISEDNHSPVKGKSGGDDKYFCTFPYPYMNGRLHLGHAFTATKAEFQARYQRLEGKRVLWPFAFHCTGMPIPACADKLKREIESTAASAEKMADIQISQSTTSVPSSPGSNTEAIHQESAYGTVTATSLGKFSGKKSKSVAKTGVAKNQWDIMAASGVPEELIPNFQDPDFWLSYFPPLCKTDLERFGVAVDWRRSFITTRRNPYYDAFIRWQFNTLKKRNRVKFGMRPTIFSRPDQQPCADHDRASGEGVGPQEYTLVKLAVQCQTSSASTRLPWEGDEAIGNRFNVYLVAATLRPETMYGQTNCYVLPDGEYGMYVAFDTGKRLGVPDKDGILRCITSREEALRTCSTLFICSQRSAENMGYQGLLPLQQSVSTPTAHPICLKKLIGTDLIGLPLSAPCSPLSTVYALPMMTISMEKGTGIVTSVPSDSPDDFAALRDLQTKPAFREKFGIADAMVDVPILDVIEIPNYGTRIAVDLCTQRKVKSQNDKQLLAEIKEETYKLGFYEGTMAVGPYKGKRVCDAKPLVREALFKSGEALPYYEPEKKVVSRSGDACVVALCNQWYLNYGDEEWTKTVKAFVTDPAQFHAYSQRCQNQFEHVVSWLSDWACSRHYGLGTYLPWEIEKGNKVLIESLSDSTIYMAYYTIAHLLQGDTYGKTPGLLNLTPQQLTDEVFDFIFEQTDDLPDKSIDVSLSKLNRLRSEFAYWYPMNLRVSGKDLIFNHLTMALFNHAAIWSSAPSTKWPKSMFCNGHVLVDAEKMSKSAGNFLTLTQAIQEFTADGTRVGLADAGDSLDDANFQRENANAALMRLYLLEQFVADVVNGNVPLREGEKTWLDLVFENELKGLTMQAKTAYKTLHYRNALKYGFFDFCTARDQYRHFSAPAPMHRESVYLWIETQAVILSPIAPHIAEYIWTHHLKKPTLVVTQQWPQLDGHFDVHRHRQYTFLVNAIEEFRRVRTKSMNLPGSSAGASATSFSGVIYVAKEFLGWQQSVLKVLQQIPLDETGRAPLNQNYVGLLRASPEIASLDKKTMKNAMSFASFRIREELSVRGPEALELTQPFDEKELLEENAGLIARVLDIENVEIRNADADRHPQDPTDRKQLALPSKPTIVFFKTPTLA